MKATNKVLICVGKGCKTPQGPDGEYCDKCYEKLYGVRVSFYQGYSGQPKCMVFIGDKGYVLDLDVLSERIKEEILEKGYTVAQSNRQKYPRIIINQ